MKAVKVGFGPETPANSFFQSGVKVAKELNSHKGFECSCYGKEPFTYERLKDLDVIIFIKILPEYALLKKLKEKGKILLLDYQDMFLLPSVYEKNPIRKVLKRLRYSRMEQRERRRFKLIDGCFVSSPVAQDFVKESGIKAHFIHRQIYNDNTRVRYKQHHDKKRGLTIFWTGVGLNLPQNVKVESALKRLCQKYDSEVVYLTDVGDRDEDCFKYRLWDINAWEEKMLEGDIAFRWWEPSNDQYHKDPNKILSYMAAGLPVVCKPTASDKIIMEHGRTGLFAQTPQEFEECVEKLICEPALRKNIGNAAHKEVWDKYSLEKHVMEIKKIIEGYLNNGKYISKEG